MISLNVALFLCFWSCQGWWEPGSGDFEYVIRPQAQVDPDGPWLVERLGHTVTTRPLVFLDDSPSDGSLPRLQTCRDSTGTLCRCAVHTTASLSSAYSFDEESYNLLQQFPAVVIVDAPALSSESSKFPSIPAGQNDLIKHALEMRRGQHVYTRCGDLCDVGFSIHRHHVDMLWLLAPIWNDDLPTEISFLSLGCHDFEEGEPLHSLVSAGIPLAGVCIDADPAAVSEARARFSRHPKVQMLKAYLRPQDVGSLIEWAMPGPSTSVDVVVLGWGGTFGADVLEAALRVVKASVVIARFAVSVPPPFRYAQHYAGEGELALDPSSRDSRATAGGASISYLVQMMADKGFLLFKMSDLQSVWVHEGLAARYVDRFVGLDFPVDEWACYLQASPVYVSDSRIKFPIDYTRAWLLEGDLPRTRQLLWGNISSISHRAPFTLGTSWPGSWLGVASQEGQ